MYSVVGRQTGTSGATIGNASFGVWNPHTTQRVKIKAIGWSQSGTGTVGSIGVYARITARGTPGSTVTPGIQNDGKYGVAPVSGLLLDLSTYSVQPTLDAAPNEVSPAVGFSGAAGGDGFYYDWEGRGIIIPPEAGIAFITLVAISIVAGSVSVFWVED